MKHRLLVSAAVILALTLPAQAQLFGPSDEEVARAKAHEDGQDAGIRQNGEALQRQGAEVTQLQQQIRDLSDRVRGLTDSLARATGANEDLGHQISVLNARLDQQQKDFSYRLCTMSAQQLGTDANSLNCAGNGAAPGAPPPASAVPPPMQGAVLPSGGATFNEAPPVGNPNRGRPPGTLGTLSGSGPRGTATPADSGGGGSDPRQFDAAMNLLARSQNAEAGAAFRAYADSHPDDAALSPQALYWVGSIAYMQQDYAGATRAFAEALKKYPKAQRAPESLLKMGQSLVAQGQASNGCTAFRAITKKQYPDASPSTLDAALTARKAANCR